MPGVFDIFLLNGTEQRRARFLSAQCGQGLPTDHATWAQGAEYVEALGQFFDLLRRAPTTDTEVEVAGQTLPAAEAERAGTSTEEVFQARYQRAAEAKSPVSLYKFLDYFEPEDADLFFGRDQEIRQLQRKFHAARLLILHGESGTGKTSLIRAGLLPRLSPESYVPVYVRALHEPARAIKEAMVRQLGVDQRHLDLPLVQFLDAETAHLSKTVVGNPGPNGVAAGARGASTYRPVPGRTGGACGEEKQRFLDLSRQTARIRRRGLWLRVGALLLLVGLGVGGAFYVQLLRSLQDANQNLAEALVEKGTSLFAQRDFLAGYIFGAKALVLDPTSARARALAYVSAMSVPYVYKDILVGHKEKVQSVAWSPDGRTLASASLDDTVRLWPQMAFFSLSPEAIYHQAQLDTGRHVEGLVTRPLDVKAWQAIKRKTAD